MLDQCVDFCRVDYHRWWMRAADTVLFVALVLVSCPGGPEPSLPFPHGVGELTCGPAADFLGMSCADVCTMYGDTCEPSCLGQDAGAMYFAMHEECLDANATYLNDNPV